MNKKDKWLTQNINCESTYVYKTPEYESEYVFKKSEYVFKTPKYEVEPESESEHVFSSDSDITHFNFEQLEKGVAISPPFEKLEKVVAISPPFEKLEKGVAISPPFEKLERGGAISPPFEKLERGGAISPPFEKLEMGGAISPPFENLETYLENFNKLKEENSLLKNKLEQLEQKLKKYTNGDNHKRYYEKNKDEIKKKGISYLKNLKLENPEKIKEYNHNAYIKRKKKIALIENALINLSIKE